MVALHITHKHPKSQTMSKQEKQFAEAAVIICLFLIAGLVVGMELKSLLNIHP